MNVICQRCGLVYVSPRPDDAELSSQYREGNFSRQARGSSLPTATKFTQSEQSALIRFRRLHRHLELFELTEGNCLEVGCGVGSFLWLMKGAGWNVSGLEPDPGYARAGEESYQVPIAAEFYESTVPLAHSFDLIAAFHVLEHVLSPRAFLQKAARDLKEGGSLYLELPCIERPYDGNLERFFWGSHLYSFSKQTLLGLLAAVGFRTVATGYSHDFLWIIARSDPSSATEPDYPLDNPDEVWLRTHRKYRAYVTRNRSLIRKSGYRLKRLAHRVLTTAKEDPDELRAGLLRVVRRQQTERMLPRPVRALQEKLAGKYLVHFGLHIPGNAGDTLLFEAVRRALSSGNEQYRYSLEPLWKEVSAETVRRLNAEARGIVIGGGGLLLRDTNSNPNSGWQWNCPTANLQQIEVPIVVFGIGYNRFRQQADFDPVFRQNIQSLVARSLFFGLRNHGSIRALSTYLEPELAERLCYQPCPTTILRWIYPEIAAGTPTGNGRTLALNIAFDRHQLRFGANQDAILRAIAGAMKWAEDHGWQIYLALHRKDDANIIPWLLHAGVNFREVLLDGRPSKQVLAFYQQMQLTVGMRGHSQMIPFGLGNSIISLISHDKLAYFLDDIGHPEWGLDIQESFLQDKMIDSIARANTDHDRIREEIRVAQEELWRITSQNLARIHEALKV